jgi:hypothetical protein
VSTSNQAPGQQNNQPSDQAKKKGGWDRFAELGPAWITSVATLLVAVTGAGFFAGRITASSAPVIQPTEIVTKTVTANPVSASQKAVPSTSTGVASNVDNGTKLGKYSFQLPSGYSAPLGPTAPTQSEIGASGGSYDVDWPSPLEPLYPGNDEQMVGLPNGSSPTYSSCTSNTTLETAAPTDEGTAFCIIETTGRVAGVVVTLAVHSANSYVTLQVTVWKNVA